jgi:ATP-binding cassette subfamily B protein
MMRPQVGAPAASGRPSAGHLLKQAFQAAAGRRTIQRDLNPLGRLFRYFRAHLADTFFGVFFVVLSSASALGLTAVGRQLVDGMGSGPRTRAALLTDFLIAGAGAAAFALTTALRIYFVNKLGERVVADLRKAVYDHVLALDLAQVLKVRTGELLSRLTTDMTIVERMIAGAGPAWLRCIISLFGALIYSMVLSPSFAGLVLVLLPIGLAPLFLQARRLRRLSAQAQDCFAEAVGYASEGLEGFETVLAFGQERAISDQFSHSVEMAFTASRRFIRARAMTTGTMILLLSAGIATVLFRCALAVMDHAMSPGVLFQLVGLSFLAASSARDLGEVWGEVFKASGALSRIGELLDWGPKIAAPARPKPLPKRARGEIEFSDVSFAYPGREDAPALSGFSLRVQPGERVALVGPSGAGKSTVFRLLLRFYDPLSGHIRIDGVDLRDADPRAARARMALVAQDAALFSASAADNIRFGRADADLKDVEAAAAAAQAADFLGALPQGFDTPVGERARTLSGGQRQRLVIARALVRNAPILLLDEATSALDAENERLVQQAMHEAMTGRTTLVIAHRLATVLEADRIIVMDRGRVVEEGRHAELACGGGLYERLARLQFAANAA